MMIQNVFKIMFWFEKMPHVMICWSILADLQIEVFGAIFEKNWLFCKIYEKYHNKYPFMCQI
jgi:hypothetical protein